MKAQTKKADVIWRRLCRDVWTYEEEGTCGFHCAKAVGNRFKAGLGEVIYWGR